MERGDILEAMGELVGHLCVVEPGEALDVLMFWYMYKQRFQQAHRFRF